MMIENFHFMLMPRTLVQTADFGLCIYNNFLHKKIIVGIIILVETLFIGFGYVVAPVNETKVLWITLFLLVYLTVY